MQEMAAVAGWHRAPGKDRKVEKGVVKAAVGED
jgi:hypothetical protein